MSTDNSGKCPPQFVFELLVAQAARLFLQEHESAEDIVAHLAVDFGELYDIEYLREDMLQGMERILVFIDSVKISDVDLMLLSFIWFTANYESLTIKRKKKTLFGSPLKGKPREPTRVLETAHAFKTYAYAVGSAKAAVKPEDWEPDDEVEFAPVFELLFPKPDEEEEEIKVR